MEKAVRGISGMMFQTKKHHIQRPYGENRCGVLERRPLCLNTVSKGDSCAGTRS
jgi:hypothetical protein